MIVTLVERGHDEHQLWQATPRELRGRLHFSEKIRKRKAAQDLATGAMAARGDEKEVRKILREAEKD